MIRKWLGVSVLAVIALVLLNTSGCARDQKLEAVTVSPSSFTYFNPAVPGATQTPIPLTAYGSYIHPPETKIITSQVTWASDNAAVADVSDAGQLTAGTVCGIANISATAYTSGNTNGNVIIGTMTTTVEGPASEGCPQSTATHNLSVNLTNPTDGTITSAPSGINCGTTNTTCSFAFPTSSTVALTAAPGSGRSFVAWGPQCDTGSGGTSLTCNVTMNSDVVVTAQFN